MGDHRFTVHRLIAIIGLAVLLGVVSTDVRAQESETQQQEASPRAAATWSIDLPFVFIDNYRRDQGDFTAGVRLGTPLWYSSLWWRFQLGLRLSGQANISPRLTTHVHLGLQGGVRVLFFSFWSMEVYLGPKIGIQSGREGSVGTTAMGTQIAYLFHPWRDNRQRLRVGVEWSRLHPLVIGDAPRLRYRGIFFGFEGSF